MEKPNTENDFFNSLNGEPADYSQNCFDMCEIHRIHPKGIEAAKLHQLNDSATQQLAGIFKILGDPTRIKLLSLLIGNEMCVCDIAAALCMEQSAISHQLRVLRNARLVKFRKEGKEAWYSLDDDHVVSLLNLGIEHVLHD